MHTHTCTHTHAHTNHRLVVAMYGWYGTFDDNRYGRNRNGQLPSNAMPSAVTYIQYAGDLEENLPAAISSEFNQFDFGVDLDEPTTELPTTTEGSPDTIDPVIVGVGAGGAITALLIILIIVLVVVCGRRRQPKRKGYEITISERRHFYMGARSLSLQPVGSIILLQVPPSPLPSPLPLPPPPPPSPSPLPLPPLLPSLPSHTHTHTFSRGRDPYDRDYSRSRSRRRLHRSKTPRKGSDLGILVLLSYIMGIEHAVYTMSQCP